ncbi:MAG: SpoIID/LytB domain-containing protein [Clostridia bacterium]|nr:SpoIID/LytB domain-containing protein [Clostridia bacterium]
MKLKYMFLTVVILVCMVVNAGATEAPLRVGLYYESTAKESVEIWSGDGFETDAAEDLGVALVATVLDGNIMLYNMARDTLIYAGVYGNEVRAVARNGVFTIDGKAYRGNVIFRPHNGKITVINEVMIDDYLRGVIAGEMPSSWPKEALKAQAVAARCFALGALNKHADYGFDVCSTTNCQVYGGIDSEKESTNYAVEETAGIVALYDGKIVNTLFSSSNGGYVEASENVWGGSYPYFQTFKDEFEKTDDISGAVWTYEISPGELKDKLAENGVDIGDILNMEVVKTSESGRVLEVKITGTKGTKSYTKSSARTFLGLRSQLYTITAPGGGNIHCLGANGQTTLTGKYYVLTDDGLNIRSTPSGGSKFVISGRGYGHGVGMSQWGAKHMSEKGYSFEDILKYYFKGIELRSYTEAIL